MGDAQDHQDMREDEEDLFGEEDFEGSEEAKELPNVIPECHKKPTVCDIVARIRRTGAGVNIAWQAELQTFLTDPDDQIRGFKRDCGGLLLPERCRT